MSDQPKKPAPTPSESLASLRKQLRGAELARDSAELHVQQLGLKIQKLLAKHPELDTSDAKEAAPA